MAMIRRAMNRVISVLTRMSALETLWNLLQQRSADLESPPNLAVSCTPIIPTGTFWKRNEHHNFKILVNVGPLIFSNPFLSLKRLYLVQYQNVSYCILSNACRTEERSNGFISARGAIILEEVQTQSGRTIKHRSTKGITIHCISVST